jgi:hypothetical protein
MGSLREGLNSSAGWAGPNPQEKRTAGSLELSRPVTKGKLRRWLMRQTAKRQLRHIGNIIVVEMAAAAQCEHGGDPLQINVTFLNWQRPDDVWPLGGNFPDQSLRAA